MPGDWTHWLFVALILLALVVAVWVWWLDRDRTYTEDDLKHIEFQNHLRALGKAHNAAPTRKEQHA